MMLIDAVTFGGQTIFSFPAVCDRKEVAHVQKKAFRLFMCAVILLYIFCIILYKSAMTAQIRPRTVID